jgi:uncharacterized membrane protein
MGLMILVFGLILFLGVHSVRMVAENWRTQTIGKIGEGAWKGGYSLVSLLGFGLLVWGFSLARETPIVLWMPPMGMRHAASLLTLFAFVLLLAAYIPGNSIKARLHHPMLLSVKMWALAHLLSNGNVAHVLLFGGFLLWAVWCFRACRQRDRAVKVVYPAGKLPATLITVVAGLAAWAGFAFWGHGYLIGIRPFGM